MNRWMLGPLVLVGCFAWTAPAARGQTLLERLEGRFNNLLTPPNAGAPQPPRAEEPGYLGLVVDDDADTGGIRVLSVRPGSPAEASGLKLDDLVSGLNGQAVARVDEMAKILERLPAGSKLTFDIRRDGRDSRVLVTLAQRPGAEPLAAPERRGFGGPTDRPALGLTVAPVTDEARARYSLTVRRGALITAITPGGPAHRAGFPIGGVIVAYDGRAMHSADDLISTVRGARVGDEVELSYYEGDQLHRKQVRLVPSLEAAASEVNRRPALEPPLVVRPGANGGAPALGRLERLLEGVARPSSSPRAESDEVLALQQQVEALQTQIEDLQQRMKDLESRLPPAKEVKE